MHDPPPEYRYEFKARVYIQNMAAYLISPTHVPLDASKAKAWEARLRENGCFARVEQIYVYEEKVYAVRISPLGPGKMYYKLEI